MAGQRRPELYDAQAAGKLVTRLDENGERTPGDLDELVRYENPTPRPYARFLRRRAARSAR